MGVLNFIKKALNSFRNLGAAIASYGIIRGIAVYGLNDSRTNIKKGYIDSADIYSIVKMISVTTASTIPIYVYKVKSKEKLKKYKQLLQVKDYGATHQVKLMFCKSEALEMVDNEHELQKLLDSPNPLYTKSEFLEGIYTLKLLTGNSYIYKEKLEFGKNAGKTREMWLMPPDTYPILTSGFPHQLQGYQLNFEKVRQFRTDEVMHLRSFNPNFTTSGDELIGHSPLVSGNKIVQRKDDEDNYNVSSFQNSGISGIVSNESLPLDQSSTDDVGSMKKQFYAEATGTTNARKLLFQAGKINYTQIGLSPIDMNVLGSELQTFKRLCNLYRVSDRLFNNDATGSEVSINAMIKQLYTNACLPEVAALCDILNKDLSKEFGDDYFIDYDITGISALQEDMKAQMEAFSAAPVMKPNLVFEAMGIGISDDPLMDKVYIKTGYTPIEDLSMQVGDL